MSGAEAEIKRLDDRLERIEGKLDQVIRLEERQNNLQDEVTRAFGRIERVEDRVRAVEIENSSERVKTGTNEYGFRVIIGIGCTVASGLLVWHFKGV
ncbi:hypothetical protein HBA55_34950 [Pseudomaricurvus alkylphenolicus]|uniref:hypothetical protein n=1 Tax=Pseudomaricurvus alkylphenolicus TaxID=1306991 RepID=UPI00142480F6|nr:hypothetical protein [Pseudomaricurvus alkylphenolicus]NIB44832.1 hypothetical protein [Pseudomaricurvus alkylphenolicus]